MATPQWFGVNVLACHTIHKEKTHTTSKLEIRFRKNLAKLTGSAVRIDSKKPKGKKTMKGIKKPGNSHNGI